MIQDAAKLIDKLDLLDLGVIFDVVLRYLVPSILGQAAA